jgi:hypothetical protein
VAALGRDEHVRGVAAVAGQGARDQALVVADVVGLEVVGVRGVDQRDARVEGGVDRGHGPRLVRPPLDRHRHAAEADGADGEVSDTTSLHDG